MVQPAGLLANRKKRMEIFKVSQQNHRKVCGGKRKPVAVLYIFSQTTSLEEKMEERKRCLQANRKANTHAQASCKKKTVAFDGYSVIYFGCNTQPYALTSISVATLYVCWFLICRMARTFEMYAVFPLSDA